MDKYNKEDLLKVLWAGFALGFIVGVAVCFIIGYFNVMNA